jgi:hypothetical protein
MPMTFLFASVGVLLLVIDFVVITTALNDYQYGRATVRQTVSLVSGAVALMGLYIWIVVALDTDALSR